MKLVFGRDFDMKPFPRVMTPEAGLLVAEKICRLHGIIMHIRSLPIPTDYLTMLFTCCGVGVCLPMPRPPDAISKKNGIS